MACKFDRTVVGRAVFDAMAENGCECTGCMIWMLGRSIGALMQNPHLSSDDRRELVMEVLEVLAANVPLEDMHGHQQHHGQVGHG